MARHLSVRHSIGRLLQAERLEVHAHAAVRDDEVWIHGTLHSASILAEHTKGRFEAESSSRVNLRPECDSSPVAFSGQSVTLQARRQGDVGDDAAATAALQAHLGGLRLDCCGGNDDAVDLHQTGDLLRLERHTER